MVGVGDGGWGGSPQRADECRPASGGSLGGVCRAGLGAARDTGRLRWLPAEPESPSLGLCSQGLLRRNGKEIGGLNAVSQGGGDLGLLATYGCLNLNGWKVKEK